MKKTFNEILDEEFNSEENYSLTSGDVDDLRSWALKLMKQVRETTLKEAVKEVHFTINGESYQYLQKNATIIAIDKKSILNLDKNSIEL